MKHPIRMLVFGLAAVCSNYASAYSGELWLSQANQRFGTPPNMLAHGFLAGVVLVGITEKNQGFRTFASTLPQIKCKSKLMGIKKTISATETLISRLLPKALFE